jgi:peptide-methionine (S)-S-oxide reductase
MNEETTASELATFGAGCFWGVESSFRELGGVLDATSGYAGGTVAHPTYQAVCSDRTGHAEVVQVRYNPAIVSYERLLDAFWEMHDPSQVDRQGPDVGRQYRSVIFYHTPAQREAAEKSKAQLGVSSRFSRPIATAIEPAPTFYPAEDYHQRYLEKQGAGN